MPVRIQRVDYFYTTLKDQPGEAYRLLAQLASSDVNLLAFGAIPVGPARSQLTLFPESVHRLAAAAEKIGLVLDGPHPALLVCGDDELGALAEIHQKLADIKVNVYAANGVTDGRGTFGYLIHVKPEDIDAALNELV
jgi:predicted amino acid-binding ACT domain protein